MTHTFNAGLAKIDMDDLVGDYITVWNMVRHKLSQFGKCMRCKSAMSIMQTK
jgi:hypothetical protein